MARFNPGLTGRSNGGRDLLVPLERGPGMAPMGRITSLREMRAAMARGGVREVNRVLRITYGIRSMRGT